MTDQRFDDGRETEEFGSIQRNKEFENGQAETKKKSRNLFSTFWSKISRRSGSTDMDVTQYLDHNQDILEAYLMKSVSVNQLETWLDRKKVELDKTHPTDYNQSLLREGGTTKDFFMNFETKLKQSGNELSSILELIHFIASVVTIDAYRIFKIDHDDTNPVKLIVMDSPNMPTDFAEAGDDIVELVKDVANKQKCLRLSMEHDSAFTNTPSTLLNKFGCEKKREAKHLLYQPISTIGKTIYVIEMWRNRAKFEDRDEEICANIVVAFHYCNLYVVKQRECNMSEVLLDDLKTIFEDMVSLDRLINSISKSAQRLVNAERASLCLVDLNSSELNQEMIRYVASSGKTLNIPNAYSDREEDVATGFKTKSILCMPIKVRGKVIAVAEMVNKKNGLNFDHRDEVAFEKFSIIFGLALHNAKLYKNIKRNGKRYKVALEILSYHNTCKEHEVQEIKNDKRALPTLNDFYLDPYELDNLQKCKAAITMFDHLFDLSKFDSMAVTKFILTVKKNYRAVPYHNFDHGWSVAHAMYVILINDHEQRFSYKMKLALFVACLCHDLDHRGYNNNYLNETASPLAAMYSSSPLEHHHFSITVIILQQDGHNIFSHLSSEDYKEVLEHIEHCILATDLAAFTPSLAKLKHSFGENSDHQSFDWEIPSNRNLAMALSMTAADLSASAKPWKIQIKTVEVIFEEFYFQGDKERDAGITPIPMMDRNKPQEKPASQVGFLNHICIPCYNMLYKIFPQTKPMYEMALENLRIWQTLYRDNSKDFEKDYTSSLELQ